jgi:hypothetical protein
MKAVSSHLRLMHPVLCPGDDEPGGVDIEFVPPTLLGPMFRGS